MKTMSKKTIALIAVATLALAYVYKQ